MRRSLAVVLVSFAAAASVVGVAPRPASAAAPRLQGTSSTVPGATTVPTDIAATPSPAAAPPTTVPAATGIGSLTGLKAARVKLFDRSDAFREVGFRVVRTADGKVLFVGCAMLATTEGQHGQGLMRRKDLAGYDAMIFWFPVPVQALFYMKTVPMDLSIGWFDGSGILVGKADMKRQGDCGDSCPLYGPGAPYRTALEVPKGGLSRLRIGASTRLVYGGTCPAARTRR